MHGAGIPSTPYSMALENYKWLNNCSKLEVTRRADELMAKVSKSYKAELLEELASCSREAYSSTAKGKKGMEGVSLSTMSSSEEIENKVAKTTTMFFNILEKMIW